MLKYSEIQDIRTRLSKFPVTDLEQCGVILPDGQIIEKPNLSNDPRNRFAFDLGDLEGVEATWHTHPEVTANLSIADFYFFKSWPNLTHFIVSSTEVRCYLTYQGMVYLVEEEEDYPSRPSG